MARQTLKEWTEKMCDECLNGSGQPHKQPSLNDVRRKLREEKQQKAEERQQARLRHGSPTFYHLLETMAELHDRKSHDYASNSNPSGNYHFAGILSKLFDNPDDAGFIGRIGEKLYRLANLENGGKVPKNENVVDTELDICVITALWMADRKDRRSSNQNDTAEGGELKSLPQDWVSKDKIQDAANEAINQGKTDFNALGAAFTAGSPAEQEYLDNIMNQIMQRCSLLNPGRMREVQSWLGRYANDREYEQSLSTEQQKQKSREIQIIELSGDMNPSTIQNAIDYLIALKELREREATKSII